jgi:hypothetical protein
MTVAATPDDSSARTSTSASTHRTTALTSAPTVGSIAPGTQATLGISPSSSIATLRGHCSHTWSDVDSPLLGQKTLSDTSRVPPRART